MIPLMKLIKYVPNTISLTRIIMCILFVNEIISQYNNGQDNTHTLFILFFMICISDFLDGKIARKTNSVSVLGAKLDVFADLFYITVSYIALVSFKIIPIWFLLFIIFKFSEFVLTSKFIKNNIKLSDKPFVFDKVGRIVSATFLIIPGIVCISKCLNVHFVNSIFLCILSMIFIAGMYSSYSRIKDCFKIYKLNNNLERGKL